MLDRRQRIDGLVESNMIKWDYLAEAVSENECPLCGSFLTGPIHRSDDGHGLKHLVCSKCKHTWTPGVNR
jgi:formate dehydrogenase maturation protein FdhE